MKSIVALALLVFAASAQAGTVLQYTLGASYEPIPSLSWVAVGDDGKVISYRKDLRKNETTIKLIARLSETALTSISDLITDIETNDQVKDGDPNAPQCSDYPPIGISIWKNGTEVVIYKGVACHEFTLSRYAGKRLVEIAKGLFDLRPN